MVIREPSPQLTALIGQMVVVDLRSTYVCLGTLVGFDDHFLDMMDADLHDFRDSSATREIDVYALRAAGNSPQPCPSSGPAG